MKAELARFLIVGLATVGIDYSIYTVLLWAGVVVSLAKGISFVGGAVFAFYTNREFTFAAVGHKHAGFRFGALYIVSLAVNIIVNRLMLALLAGQIFPAFLVATAISAAMNFFGMRHFVFMVSEARR